VREYKPAHRGRDFPRERDASPRIPARKEGAGRRVWQLCPVSLSLGVKIPLG
jgi:hypothetical protein